VHRSPRASVPGVRKVPRGRRLDEGPSAQFIGTVTRPTTNHTRTPVAGRATTTHEPGRTAGYRLRIAAAASHKPTTALYALDEKQARRGDTNSPPPA
jgi:hypothetical protein